MGNTKPTNTHVMGEGGERKGVRKFIQMNND